jgi:hypothetical protein
VRRVSDNIKIQVTAKDDASDDFQRIGKAAQTMGQQVQNAGKASASGLTPVGPAAKNAQKALADVETQAKKTAASSDDIKKRWTEAGAAAGTLVAGLALVGRAYVDQERQIDGLERAYGEASVQLLEFAEQIQQTTVYSNDAARAATLSAASLAQNYGLTADQIEQVVQASADLATVTGIDLADATSRVAGAIRGEGEAAELLGLNMSDAAVQALAAAAGIEGWNTTMTEGEKAAFRFSVAMDQAAFATGAAADAADTNAGNARQFVNALQDQAQALGGAIGPAAEYASVLGSFALAAPVAGAALGRLATGVRIAASALGPAGLIAAGVGAVVVLGEMTDWFGLFGDEAEAAVPPVEDLSAAVLQLAQAGAAAETITRLTGATGELKAALDDISTDSVLDEIDAATQAAGDIAKTQGLIVNIQNLIETGTSSGNAALDAQVAKIRELRGELETLKADGESVAVGLVEGIIGRLDEPLIDVNHVLADLATNIHLLKTDQITLGEFNTAVQGMTDNFGDLYAILPVGTAALSAQRREWEQYQRAIEGANIAARGVGPLDLDDQGPAGQEALAAAAERSATAMGHLRAATAGVKDQLKAVSTQAAETAAETAEAIEAAQSAVVDYIASGENLLQLLYESGKALSGDQGFIGGVIDLQNALTGLGSAYSIIIDGSNALGESSAALADHYSKLVGISIEANGQFVYEASLIDDLRAKRIISETEYQNAIDATTRILTSNMNIQNSIAEIQIQQAPYLANLNAEAAEYVNNLANQDAQQQRNVLTLMDANSQQQLAAIYSAATADAMGNLGANGGEFVQAMVDGLQVTNPLLYDMLQTTGEIDANGVFQFDGGDANALVDTLADLNTTLGDLAQLIADINGMTIAPKVDQQALDALLGIGKYTAATSQTGDATGGPMGVSGGGNVRSEPTEKTETITITANAEPYFRVMGDVKTFTAELVGTEQQLIVTADNSQAIGVFRDTEGSIVAITANDHIVKVTGDPTDATNDIALVNQVLNDLNNTHGLIYVDGDPSGATGAVDTAAGALGGIDGSSANITIFGDNGPAMYAINQVSGYVGTAYIDVVARVVNSPSAAGQAAGFAFRDGGIVGYDAAAVDGIVTKSGQRRILVGEAGPEIVSLPPGSGVTPSAMTNALVGGHRGGKEVHLHFHGAVYGFDDFQQQIAQGVRSAMYQGQYQ